jgi:hypothetical protein
MVKKKINLHAINIEGWKNKTNKLVSTFRAIHFQHIYKEKCGGRAFTKENLVHNEWKTFLTLLG